MSYLGTRSRATRSAEEARIEKEVGERSEGPKRKKRRAGRGQLRRIPQHVRIYVLPFSPGKILSHKSSPVEKLLARKGRAPAVVDRRPIFVPFAAIKLAPNNKLGGLLARKNASRSHCTR